MAMQKIKFVSTDITARTRDAAVRDVEFGLFTRHKLMDIYDCYNL